MMMWWREVKANIFSVRTHTERVSSCLAISIHTLELRSNARNCFICFVVAFSSCGSLLLHTHAHAAQPANIWIRVCMDTSHGWVLCVNCTIHSIVSNSYFYFRCCVANYITFIDSFSSSFALSRICSEIIASIFRELMCKKVCPRANSPFFSTLNIHNMI